MSPDAAKIQCLLRQYRTMQSAIARIDAEIWRIETQMEYDWPGIESDDDIIRGLALQSPILSFAPRGGGVADPTPRIAESYEKQRWSKAEQEQAAKHQIKQLKYEKYRYECQIRNVEAFLKGLSETERWVAERFFIQGYTWAEVEKLAEKELPIPKSRAALKRIKNELINKIEIIYAKSVKNQNCTDLIRK